MTFRRRAVIALFLLLTMPLRVFAAGTMPCCPLPAPSMHHGMSMPKPMPMADHAMSTPASDPAQEHAQHHAHSADRSTCCTIALMSSPVIELPLRPDMPAVQRDEHIESCSAFLTDAPERPPRPTILPA